MNRLHYYLILALMACPVTANRCFSSTIPDKGEETTTSFTNNEKDAADDENSSITVNGVTFKMIRVKGGTFTMGATPEQKKDAKKGEKPAHEVTLSDYYIAETEVTQELWEAVLGKDENHSDHKGADHPVEAVSWEDCDYFITKLNELTGRQFRFPTEAEWEFAARGGCKSKGYKYSGSNNLSEVAWYNDIISGTHPVKGKAPNELGIYDMSGNVDEYCNDYYGRYSKGSQTNPKGPADGGSYVIRGGNFCGEASECRVSSRGSTVGYIFSSLGFRLAM